MNHICIYIKKNEKSNAKSQIDFFHNQLDECIRIIKNFLEVEITKNFLIESPLNYRNSLKYKIILRKESSFG